MSDPGDRLIKEMMGTMNLHIPSRRVPLSELMDMDDPSYTGRDGRKYQLARDELVRIAAILTEFELSRLRIPIPISTDTSSDIGCWRVDGSLEVKVIAQLLGRKPEMSDRMRLYFPHMRELRRLLPTCTIAMYVP